MSTATLDAVDRGIPRRLSARMGDRHFDAGMIALLSDRVDVILNGEVLKDATAWDVDAGQVTRQRRHKNGSLALEQGAPTFETLKGVVEVRWSKGAAA